MTTNDKDEINQCDGCRVGAPLTVHGHHAMPGGGFMACSKHLYMSGKSGDVIEKIIAAAMDCIRHDVSPEWQRAALRNRLNVILARQPAAIDKQEHRSFTEEQIAALRVAADALIERYAAPIRAILSDAEIAAPLANEASKPAEVTCQHGDWKLAGNHGAGNSPWVCGKCGTQEKAIKSAAPSVEQDDLIVQKHQPAEGGDADPS